MNKSDLTQIVAQKAHLTQKASREAVDTLLDEVFKALTRGESVLLSGFGTFKIDTKNPKDIVGIGSGKRMTIGSHHVARFIPSVPLKKAVW